MYQMEEMLPEEMDDNEYMTKNLIETVTLLCRNNLKYNFELKIQGLLAITTDNQNVIVVQINEALPKKASSVTHMGSGSNMMDCGPPPQGPPRGMVGNIPSVSGMPRGRATHMKSRPSRRGMGGMPRMKQPAMLQNQVTPRLRVRQQQFSKPQKRPIPSMMRSPGSAPIRAPMLQMSPQQHMDEDSETLVPYEPPTLRRTQVRRPQAVRPKAELVEGDEAFVAPKRPIKRELSSSQPASEICVLSDEEDINPPLLKAEVNQSPLRKRQMPMLSSELDESSCSGIIQDSIAEISGTEKAVAVQRVQVKSEAMPSVEVDSVKEETEWSTSSQWQETSHCCSQCMLTFPNMRGLRQHVRNAHPDGVPISSKALVMMVDSVITSPASSSTNAMHSSCRIDDDLGEII